jgi:toxin ParE1/3/4
VAARPAQRLPIVRRARADLDIHEALNFYITASASAARGFVGALERAFKHIERAPGSGSPRWAYLLDIPGLRSWPCGRYPYLVFYVVHADRIEVWRVLHGARDIPAWLADEAP